MNDEIGRDDGGRRTLFTARVLLGLAVASGCGDDGASTGTEGSSSTMGPTSTTDPSVSTTMATTDTGPTSGSSGADESSGSEDTGGPPLPPATGCVPLPPPEGDVVELGPEDDLAAAIADAPTGRTLVLRDGTYDVSSAGYIVFDTPGVTLRSQSGDPSAVVLDGGYGIGSVLNVRASDVTIAELTIQRPMWHPIHVTGGTSANTEGTMIYRVRVIDPGEQGIKINASGEGFYSDGGTVACSHLELTDAGRSQVSGCYTGGIDAHLAWGWEIRDNYIEGFWCDQGLSEHAVHFWNGARDTLVERNVIVDCARGVGFGLGNNGNGTTRDYEDDPCPGVGGYVGHFGGIIRNNTVWAARPELFDSQSGFDSGVALEQACETQVVHNTVVSLQPPFVSMEYRFPNTQATIANNLVTHTIAQRDGGQAMLMGNLSDQGTEHFVDAAGGDLHLVDGSAAIDAGEGLPAGLADEDFEGDPRDGSPDVGADER
ncbi:right-handed parallel beta-helix repeat-containing protein [Paraliomyxa miuraensis]|uniref:right-handed parallel beta-helix repeat-containing protein n=1 Tax=Paraliomyxa miuraensis TaxID=376150 RepID=UPI002251DC60|nr:right-handed parallel beta-helix repeat-containing protein [Paraliomyxa miuraensis]MCX4247242.1 right-handed parallel beta-helix repeat-containing protein [Paraliomyxa miuraensis]